MMLDPANPSTWLNTDALDMDREMFLLGAAFDRVNRPPDDYAHAIWARALGNLSDTDRHTLEHWCEIYRASLGRPSQDFMAD